MFNKTEYNVTSEERNEFKDAMRLYFRRIPVSQYNMKRLLEHSSQEEFPIRIVQAMHQCAFDSRSDSSLYQDCKSVLRLSFDARIRLNCNVWTNVGLFNGGRGVVYDIIDDPTADSEDALPLVVLVKMDEGYCGPSCIGEDNERIVPIVPREIARKGCELGKGRNRRQIPLSLDYARTIHKAEGLNLDKAVVTLSMFDAEFFVRTAKLTNSNNVTISGGNSDPGVNQGIALVGLSRTNFRSDMLFNAFKEERLTNIGQSEGWKSRRYVLTRTIPKLAQQTHEVSSKLYERCKEIVPPPTSNSDEKPNLIVRTVWPGQPSIVVPDEFRIGYVRTKTQYHAIWINITELKQYNKYIKEITKINSKTNEYFVEWFPNYSTSRQEKTRKRVKSSGQCGSRKRLRTALKRNPKLIVSSKTNLARYNKLDESDTEMT